MIRPTTPPILAACLLLSACGGAAQAPLDSQVTHAPGVTLPPAWTPTATFTRAPATPTASPTPSSTPGAPVTLRPGGPAIVVPTLPAPQIVTAIPGSPNLSGWQRVDVETASFWLPASYEIADLSGFGDLMAIFLAAFSEGMTGMFDEMVSTAAPGLPTPTPISLDELEQAFDIDLLMALDASTQAAAVLMGQPSQPETSLDDLVTEALQGISGSVELERYERIEGARYATARAFVGVVDPETGQRSRQLVYAFMAGGRAWALSYACPAESFEGLLPVFEASARSFQVR